MLLPLVTLGATYTGTVSLSGVTFNTWFSLISTPTSITGEHLSCFTRLTAPLAITSRFISLVTYSNATGGTLVFRITQSWSNTQTLSSSSTIKYVCSDSFGFVGATGGTGAAGATGATGPTWPMGATGATWTTTIITSISTGSLSITGLSFTPSSYTTTGAYLIASSEWFGNVYITDLFIYLFTVILLSIFLTSWSITWTIKWLGNLFNINFSRRWKN